MVTQTLGDRNAYRRRLVDLGESPPRKKRKFVQNDDRIERVVRRYQEYKEEQQDVLDGDWDAGFLKYLKTLGQSTSGNFLLFSKLVLLQYIIVINNLF